MRTNRRGVLEPYWQDETDWLCTIEFVPTDDPEARLLAADIIGYLCGYAHLTDTRLLALLGDPDASEYELLFSFVSPTEKDQFLDLVPSNEDLGNDYIENDFGPPTTEEIRIARPLATVLPHDALTHAVLIAATLCRRTEDDRVCRKGAQSLRNVSGKCATPSALECWCATLEQMFYLHDTSNECSWLTGLA